METNGEKISKFIDDIQIKLHEILDYLDEIQLLCIQENIDYKSIFEKLLREKYLFKIKSFLRSEGWEIEFYKYFKDSRFENKKEFKKLFKEYIIQKFFNYLMQSYRDQFVDSFYQVTDKLRYYSKVFTNNKNFKESNFRNINYRFNNINFLNLSKDLFSAYKNELKLYVDKGIINDPKEISIELIDLIIIKFNFFEYDYNTNLNYFKKI